MDKKLTNICDLPEAIVEELSGEESAVIVGGTLVLSKSVLGKPIEIDPPREIILGRMLIGLVAPAPQ